MRLRKSGDKSPIQAMMRNRSDWGVENDLHPRDKAYLHLLAAIYIAAIDDIRGVGSKGARDRASALKFIKNDPYGFLDDEMKRVILNGGGKE